MTERTPVVYVRNFGQQQQKMRIGLNVKFAQIGCFKCTKLEDEEWNEINLFSGKLENLLFCCNKCNKDRLERAKKIIEERDRKEKGKSKESYHKEKSDKLEAVLTSLKNEFDEYRRTKAQESEEQVKKIKKQYEDKLEYQGNEFLNKINTLETEGK